MASLKVSNHDILDFLGHGVQIGLRSHAGGDQLLAECYDAVLSLPCLDFLFRAVRRGVGGRVAAITVGQHVDQHGAVLFLLEDRFLAAVAVDYGQRIVAVDALGVHLGRVDAGTDTGREVEAHRLAASLSAHAVLVVHDVDDHRQAAFHLVRPQLLELVHRGEGHAFPHRTAGHRRVAQVGYDDARLAVHFLIEGCAHGDAAAAAHDRVVRIDAERREERVHTAAQTLVESGRAGEYLGQRPVKQEADTQLFGRAALERLLGDVYGGAVPELVHDLLEALVVQQLDRAQTLGENFAVAAVRSENEVVDVEHIGHADGCGFLTGRQVGGARVVVLDAVVSSGRLDELQHRLELADHDHVAVDPLQVVLGEMLGLELVLDRLVVLVDGNRRERDLARFPHLRRIDILRLRHNT